MPSSVDGATSEDDVEKTNEVLTNNRRKQCLGLSVVICGCIMMIVIWFVVLPLLMQSDHTELKVFGNGNLDQGTKSLGRDADFENAIDSESAKRISSNILRKMNLSVDPCENFYQFACQGWQNNSEIRDSHLSWSVLEIIVKQTLTELNELMDKEVTSADLESFKTAHKEYEACLRNPTILFSNKQYCLFKVYINYPVPMRNKYAKLKYKSAAEYGELVDEAQDILRSVKRAFLQLQAESATPHDNASLLLSQKLDSIQACIGYPIWIFNDTRVELEQEEINSNNGAVLKYFCYDDNNSNKEHCNCTWIQLLATDIASYFPNTLQVYVKSNFLSWSAVEFGKHKALRYGSVGTIIGHEIAHGATTNASNLNISQIKSDSTETCLVAQYSNFTTEELKRFVNGSLTLVENLADNIGLLLAYNAYKGSTKYAESKLPGLEEYSDDQLFFLGYAQTWCESYKLESMLENIEASSHCPSMFRILGTLQNSPEFATAWKCSVGSGMNPKEKCVIFPI